MKLLRLTLALAATALTMPGLPLQAAAAPTADEADSAMKSLDKVIPYGKALLAKKQYQKFLLVFDQPDDTRHSGHDEKVVAEFAKSDGADLLELFTSAVGVKPTVSEDGKKAVFKGTESIIFVRIGDRWYLEK